MPQNSTASPGAMTSGTVLPAAARISSREGLSSRGAARVLVRPLTIVRLSRRVCSVSMYTVERIEGRLIEARIASPLGAQDVDGIIQSVRMNVIAQSEKVICVADLTRLDGLAADAVDAFVAMFTRDNPRMDRS